MCKTLQRFPLNNHFKNLRCFSSFKVDRQVRIYGISIFGREPLVLAGRLLKPRGTLVFKYGVRLLNEDLKILVDQQGWPKIVGENVFVKFDKPCKILPNKMYTLVSTVKVSPDVFTVKKNYTIL
jgi:hypothetical protein